MKIILESILENISTRNDGSIKLVLATQEILPEKAGELFQMRNKFIKILLSDSNITEQEEKLLDELTLVDGKKVKTKSQRLRAVIYRIHEHQGGSKDNFDEYYNETMEKIILHFKEKLD